VQSTLAYTLIVLTSVTMIAAAPLLVHGQTLGAPAVETVSQLPAPAGTDGENA